MTNTDSLLLKKVKASDKKAFKELFYNFHDIHIDFGLRFGLVVIIFVLTLEWLYRRKNGLM